MIPDKILKTLKVCFWLNIMTFTGMIILNIVTIFSVLNGEIYKPDLFLTILIGILELPILFLFGYSVYFFYKYDKYSKSGIYFLFFHLLYANIYFYKIIWKRKRELINSYENEQVLENKIFIETENDEEK
jgi:hypothetical protein